MVTLLAVETAVLVAAMAMVNAMRSNPALRGAFGVFTYRVPPMAVTLKGTQERYAIA